MGSHIHTFSLPHRPHLLPNPQPQSLIQHKSLLNSLHFNPILQIPQRTTSTTSHLKKPISYHPLITSSTSPHKRIPNFISEKIVTLLVGSLVFMGGFNKRPVLAQPMSESSQSQRTETQSDEESSESRSKETLNGEFDEGSNGSQSSESQRSESQRGEAQSDEIDEEEMMYMKLSEDNPRNVEALKLVFYGKMKRGKTKEAVKYVERLIAVEPKEVEWRLLQALCYEMIGELSKAKSLFKKILRRRPLLLRALHGLAMVMHKNLEGPAVFEMLNKALELARQKKRVTEERNIKILIAQMHVVKGELDNALKLFKDLVDENPRDFRPYLCQGIVYSLLDKKEEAEEQFSTYQSLVPDEFAQRGFLDDVVLAAKTKSRQPLQKEFKPEFSYKK